MSDYERGREQFRKMVGDEQIDHLIERFQSLWPGFREGSACRRRRAFLDQNGY